MVWRIAKVALALAVTLVVEPKCSAHPLQKSFSIKNDVELSRVQSGPVYSPDRKYFYLVTERGLLEKNRPEDTIRIFSVEQAQRFLHAPNQALPPSPFIVAQLSDFKDGPEIGDVQWLTNSSGLTFLALTRFGNYRLFEYSMRSHATKALTPSSQNIVSFSRAGDYLAYATNDQPPEASRHEPQAGFRDVTGERFWSLIFAHSYMPPAFRSDDFSTLWVKKICEARPVPRAHDSASCKPRQIIDQTTRKPIHLHALGPGFGRHSEFSISADGKFLMALEPVSHIPKGWQAYSSPRGYGSLKKGMHFGIDQNLQTHDANGLVDAYDLIDLKTGSITQVINAPSGHAFGWNSDFHAPRPRWSEDGRSVILPNTFLEPDTSGSKSAEATAHPCIAVFEVSTRRLSCVTPLVEGMKIEPHLITDTSFFVDDRHSVVVRYGTSLSSDSEKFSKAFQQDQRGFWVERPSRPDPFVSSPSFNVDVAEDFNHPPSIIISDPSTHITRKLWEPNPELAGIDLGAGKVIHWVDASGFEWTGALLFPPDYDVQRRYPMVIQTHGFSAKSFLSDGAYPTAMPGRALAANGVLVLQVGWNPQHMGDAGEVEDQIDGLGAIVKKLDRERVIDANRVGMIGFSRTVFHTFGVLAARSPRLAAASVIDGVDGGYWQYIASVASGPDEYRRELNVMNGAPPFGAGLMAWKAHSPLFNLENNHAPVLIMAPGSEAVMANWQPYAVLYAMHKPVDLVLLAAGSHEETNPQQRLVSAGLNLDWFRFWLQGYEDPNAEKRAQYVRWEKLCDLQNSSTKDHPTFCVPTKH